MATNTLQWLVFLFPVSLLSRAIALHSTQTSGTHPLPAPTPRVLVPIPGDRDPQARAESQHRPSVSLLPCSCPFANPSSKHFLLLLFCKTIISRLWFRLIYNPALPSNNELWRKIMGRSDIAHVWRNKWEQTVKYDYSHSCLPFLRVPITRAQVPRALINWNNTFTWLGINSCTSPLAN